MRARKIYFVTQNKHKVKQAMSVLKEFGISVIWLDKGYEESKEDSIDQVALKSSKMMAEKTGKFVMVEDTGVFFDAYPSFPGALPKWVHNTLGYKGYFKLLRGEKKTGRFVSALAVCRPGKKPKLFIGEMKGRFILKVKYPDKDVLPYERWFICDGTTDVLAGIPFNEKLILLHRTKALKKLGKYLSENSSL